MDNSFRARTVRLKTAPYIISNAAVVGEKEGQGPLKDCFDLISPDPYFGEKTWEKGESRMLKQCYSLVCGKAGLHEDAPDYILSGDLLNQCISSAFAMRDTGVPYFGLYGACSTMAEGLSLGAMLVDGGYGERVCAVTGSHFCSAERQYRFPLEYGGQRCPSSQWTVTGAGGLMLAATGRGPRVTHVTTGRIVDGGIDDANNMGAAMTPAAFDTIVSHFRQTGRDFDYYDAVFTGDLGALGHDLLEDMLRKQGYHTGARYMDCGVLIYDLKTQDVHAGGSGCGCSASVLCGHIIDAMRRGIWNRVLFAATGALMSPVSTGQGQTIPGICHAVAIENEV